MLEIAYIQDQLTYFRAEFNKRNGIIIDKEFREVKYGNKELRELFSA